MKKVDTKKTKHGFVLCEWDNNEQQDTCENCGSWFDKIYYRKTNDHDGQYWCMMCIKAEEKANIKK